jgi:hypothetical protein
MWHTDTTSIHDKHLFSLTPCLTYPYQHTSISFSGREEKEGWRPRRRSQDVQQPLLDRLELGEIRHRELVEEEDNGEIERGG